MNDSYSLAIELLNNKKSVYELDCKQVEKMIKYFENELIIKRKELENIENNIKNIREKIDC